MNPLIPLGNQEFYAVWPAKKLIQRPEDLGEGDDLQLKLFDVFLRIPDAVKIVSIYLDNSVR